MNEGAWTTLNAFLAKLTARNVSSCDFSLYGLWLLRDCLEEEVTPQYLDKALPAASQWIRHATQVLRESSQEWPKSPTPGDPARGTLLPLDLILAYTLSGGSLWVDKRGFCKERWSFWRDRLLLVKESQGTTTELAREMAEIMQ